MLVLWEVVPMWMIVGRPCVIMAVVFQRVVVLKLVMPVGTYGLSVGAGFRRLGGIFSDALTLSQKGQPRQLAVKGLILKRVERNASALNLNAILPHYGVMEPVVFPSVYLYPTHLSPLRKQPPALKRLNILWSARRRNGVILTRSRPAHVQIRQEQQHLKLRCLERCELE
jgi:hypothetical protein